MPKIETFMDKTGKYRFRLKAPNGEIIAVGQAYDDKSGLMTGIESLKKNAPIADIIDLSKD